MVTMTEEFKTQSSRYKALRETGNITREIISCTAACINNIRTENLSRRRKRMGSSSDKDMRLNEDKNLSAVFKRKTANASSNPAKERILEQMDDFKSNIEQTFLILMVFSLIAIVIMSIRVLRLGIRESDKFLKPIQHLIGGEGTHCNRAESCDAHSAERVAGLPMKHLKYMRRCKRPKKSAAIYHLAVTIERSSRRAV